MKINSLEKQKSTSKKKGLETNLRYKDLSAIKGPTTLVVNYNYLFLTHTKICKVWENTKSNNKTFNIDRHMIIAKKKLQKMTESRVLHGILFASCRY